MTYSEITEIMNQHYIAESGLGRINLQDTAVLPNGVESCNNENGILFLAYMIARGVTAGAHLNSEVARSLETIKSLEKLPGLYNRQPGGTAYERHDNYIGICALCALAGNTEYPQNMIDWWWGHWGTFNNVEPLKFKKEQIRQPGELAIYYVAADRDPPMFCWLWFLIGMVINGFKSKPNAPQARLVWLRTFIVGLKISRLGFIKRFLYKSALGYWLRRTAEKHANVWGFPKGHPVRLFDEAAPTDSRN